MSLDEIFEILSGHDLRTIEDQFIMDENSYHTLRNYIQNIQDNHYPKGISKGDYLEEFLTFLIKKNKVFEYNKNIRSSTNEIDLRVETRGNFIPILNYHYKIHNCDVIYFECKNYNEKIDVTWIGKFFSLLNTSKRNLGIFISPYGLTGSNWKYGNGLTRKIALKNDIYILSITLEDLLELDKKSLLMIIREKIILLEEDIEIEFSKHDLEDDIEFTS